MVSLRLQGCVNFLRGEFLHSNPIELRAFYDSAPDEWGTALTAAFAMSNLTNLTPLTNSSLADLHRQLAGFEQDNQKLRCACTSRGALVRLDVLDGRIEDLIQTVDEGKIVRSVRELCVATSGNPILRRVRPVVLVRTDLMRWSLSTYGRFMKDEASWPANPQFGKSNLTSHVYDLSVLSKSAFSAVRIWNNIAVLLRAMRDHCKMPPLVQSYEAFEDRGGLPEGTADALLPCYRGRAQAMGTRNQRNVRIAHSHKISNFVSNSNEVIAHFAVTPYPTFAQALTKEGLRPDEVLEFSESVAACTRT